MASRNLFLLASFDASPEYSDASPEIISTWLAMHFFCTAQENGGVIASCLAWNDRQWNSVLRGRGGRRAVIATVDAGLAGYRSTDLVVFGYDVAGEAAYLSQSGRGPKFDAPIGNAGSRRRTELKVSMERERRDLEMQLNAERVRHTEPPYGMGPVGEEGEEGEEGHVGSDMWVGREGEETATGEADGPPHDTQVDLGDVA